MANHLFAWCVAGCFRSRAVRYQREDSLRAQSRQQGKVGCLAVGRSLIELEVSCVHHGADRRVNRVAHRIWDRMPDTERLDGERSDLEVIAWVERAQGICRDLVLFQLVGEESSGEGAGVDRHAWQLGQDVRERANMILVPMRDQYGLDRRLALPEVADVWDDDVDAEGRVVREGEPTVDKDDRFVVLVEVEVLADLPHPTQRDQAERRAAWCRSLWSSSWVRAVPRLAMGRRPGLPAPLAVTHPFEPAPAATLMRARPTCTPLFH